MFGKTLPRSEKLKAAGAFGAIALSSVVAFDLMLFSGFQVDPPPSNTAQAATPNEPNLDMIDGGWRSAYVTTATAWDAQFADDAFAEDDTDENLAGDVRPPQDGYRNALYNVPSEDELYREIAALYAEQDRRAAERESERAEVEPEPEPEYAQSKAEMAEPQLNPEPVTAYESASPW